MTRRQVAPPKPVLFIVDDLHPIDFCATNGPGRPAEVREFSVSHCSPSTVGCTLVKRAVGGGQAECLTAFSVLVGHCTTDVNQTVLIAALPLALGVVIGRRVWHTSSLKIMSAVSGGMISTPGLAAITGDTESSDRVVSYVAAYPSRRF